MLQQKSEATAKATLVEGERGAPQPKSSLITKSLHLTSLPADILIQIWAQFERDEDTPGPICKALLPYQRPIPFRRIRLDGPDLFDSLQEVLAAEPTLGSYCLALRISMMDSEETGISSRDLKKFFSSLISLKTISIMHYPRAALLLLSPEVAQECFGELEEVEFGDCIIEPWGLYQNLGYYQKLKKLTILHPGALGTSLKPPADSIPPQALVGGPLLRNISSFHWEGGWTATTSDALLPTMPSLKTFLLYHSNCTAEVLVHTLRALPSSLSTLGIGIEHRRALKNQTLFIDEELARLTHLEQLILDTLHINPSIFRHLKNPLPLEYLRFGEYTKSIIHQDDILKLLDPGSPLHNSTLSNLELNNLRGPKIGEEGSSEWALESVLEVFQDPEWIEGQMDLAGVQAIVELGKIEG